MSTHEPAARIDGATGAATNVDARPPVVPWLYAAALVATLALSRHYIADAYFYSSRVSAAVPLWAPLAAIPVVVALAFLLHSLVARAGASALNGLDLAMLVWVGAAAASALAVDEPAPFFAGDLFTYFAAALAFLVARALAPDGERLGRALAIAAALVAVTVLLDAEGLWPSHGVRRPGGLLHNRNYAAEYLALALPFACAIAHERKWLAVAVLLSFALGLTRCRTAWLAAAAGVAALALLSWRARRRLRYAIAAPLVGAILALLVPTRLHWESSSLETASHLVALHEGSGLVRWRQLVETVRLVVDRPTGLGPGRWREEMRGIDPTLAVNINPHSDYVRALATGGVPCLAGLLLVFGMAAFAAWRSRGEPARLAFVVAAAVVSAGDAMLYRLETLTATMFVLGMLAAGARPVERAESVDGRLQDALVE